MHLFSLDGRLSAQAPQRTRVNDEPTCALLAR
jgi:hypothetical protein